MERFQRELAEATSKVGGGPGGPSGDLNYQGASGNWNQATEYDYGPPEGQQEQ